MTNGGQCVLRNNSGQNRDNQTQEGRIKIYTGKRLLMIKDSNTLEQAWEEFMKCPSLEVLRKRQNKHQHRLRYALLIISSDRRMDEVKLS